MSRGQGSRIVPDLSCYKDAIKHLRTCILKPVNNSIEEICRAHNTYTHYTLQLIAAATGIRPATDPLACASHVQLDYGFVLVNDKSATWTHANRLVALAPIVIEQWRNYVKHLGHLMVWLQRKHLLHEARQVALLLDAIGRRHGSAQDRRIYVSGKKYSSRRSTGTKIQQVVRALNIDHPLPMFFLLEPHGGLTQYCFARAQEEVDWPFRTNAQRHLYATEMARQAPHWIIDAQLGHIIDGHHPFGLETGVSPRDALSVAASAAQALLTEYYGWAALVSPLPGQRDKVQKSLQALLPADESGQAHRLLWTWSIVAAEESRRRIDARLTKLVTDLRAMPEDQLRKTLSERHDQILREIRLYHHYPDAASKALRALQSDVARLLPGKRSAILDEAVQIVSEPSPMRVLLPDACSAYQLAITRFQRFVEATRFGKNCPVEQWWALTVVSAALHGLLNPSRVMSLGSLGPRSLRQVNALVYVDFPYEKSEDHASDTDDARLECRWIADPVSRALIERGLTLGPHYLKADLKQAAFTEALHSIVTDLLGFEADPDNTAQGERVLLDRVQDLIAIASAHWQLMLPNYLFRIASGDSRSTPLSEMAFARLAAGLYPQHASLEVSAPAREVVVQTADIISVSQHGLPETSPDTTHRESRPVIHPSYRLFSKWMAENAHQGLTRAKSNKRTRDALVGHLMDWLEAHSADLHPNVKLLGLWTYVLLAEHRNLSVGTTIRDYTSCVSKVLQLGFENQILKELSEEEIEEGLVQGVKASKQRNKLRLLQIVGQFMHLVELLERLPSVEWEAVYAQFDLTYVGQVAANLVTKNDYQECRRRIRKVNDETLRATLECGLILAYRFGLRVGEVSRLCLQDVQLAEQSGSTLIWIQVSATKTFSGTRQIAPLDPLPADEIHVIKEQYRAAAVSSDDRLRSRLLFGYSILACREILSTEIGSLLRFITGDPAIRFHDLRHSRANTDIVKSAVATLFAYRAGNADAERKLSRSIQMFNRLLPGVRLGRTVDTGWRDVLRNNCWLSGLRSEMGHSAPSVTLHSYFHLSEILVALHVSSDCGYTLSASACRALTGLDEEALRQKRRSLRMRGVDRHELLLIPEPISAVPGPADNLITASEHFRSLPPYDLERSGNRDLTLDRLHLILSLAHFYRDEPSLISRVSGMPLKTVETALAAAIRVEHRAAYHDYAVSPDHPQYIEAYRPAHASFKRHRREFPGWLARAQNRLSSLGDDIHSELDAAISTWCDTYYRMRDRDVFLIDTTDEWRRLQPLLRVFGKTASDFRFGVPKDLPTPRRQALEVALQREAPAVPVSRSPLTLSHHTYHRSKHCKVAVVFREGGKDVARSARALHRGLFLLAVLRAS